MLTPCGRLDVMQTVTSLVATLHVHASYPWTRVLADDSASNSEHDDDPFRDWDAAAREFSANNSQTSSEDHDDSPAVQPRTKRAVAIVESDDESLDLD